MATAAIPTRILVLVAILAAVLAGVWLAFRRPAAAPRQQAASPAAQTAPTDLVLQGQIEATDLVDVPVLSEGQLTAVHVEAGADVYEGQLLAEIRSESLSTALQSAEQQTEQLQERVHNLEAALAAAKLEASRASADAARVRGELERARRNHERQKMLLDAGATPRQTFERAEKEFRTLQSDEGTLGEVSKAADARIGTLQSELDAIRKRLDDKVLDMETAKARVDAGQILAPASGVIAARKANPGDEVHPGMTDLFRIATDLSSLKVTVLLPAAQIGRVRPGQPALITVADNPEPLTGAVSTVAEGKAVVEFSNPSPLVKPGQTAQVRIRIT